MKAYHSQRLLEERRASQLARDLPAREAVTSPAAKPAAVKSARRGPPVCVDCEAHSWAFEWITGRITHRCHEPMTRDPVTGAPTDPVFNRRNAMSCGPQGQYWRAKTTLPVPVERATTLPDTEPEEYVPPVPVRMLSAPPRDELVVELWERP